MRYILATAAAALVLLSASCGPEGERPTTVPTAEGVAVMTVSLREVPIEVELASTVRAVRVADISARTRGTVTSISVKEGDRVTEGQVLATLDDREAAQMVVEAERAYDQARRALLTAAKERDYAVATFERYRALYEEKAVSRHEMEGVETKKDVAVLAYESASAAAERAEAALEAARTRLGYTRIAAPFDGVVTAKSVERGELAVPGRPLFRVEDDSRYRAEMEVDEKLAGRLGVGDTVELHIDALGEVRTAHISEIVPSVDPSTRTVLIKADIDDAHGLRTGLYARAVLRVGTRRALLVPRSGIVRRGQLRELYVVGPDGTLGLRLVRLGKVWGDEVEVVAGLEAGETIVTEGIEGAAPGARIPKR